MTESWRPTPETEKQLARFDEVGAIAHVGGHDETEVIRLTGWGTFDELSIRPILFGHMVKRATLVVKEYLSDLYHDAHWLDQHVTGETEFDFLVRHSGTGIGEAASIGVQIGAGAGAVFYRIRLYVEHDRFAHRLLEDSGPVSGMWMADFTRIPLEAVL